MSCYIVKLEYAGKCLQVNVRESTLYAFASLQLIRVLLWKFVDSTEDAKFNRGTFAYRETEREQCARQSF